MRRFLALFALLAAAPTATALGASLDAPAVPLARLLPEASVAGAEVALPYTRASVGTLRTDAPGDWRAGAMATTPGLDLDVLDLQPMRMGVAKDGEARSLARDEAAASHAARVVRRSELAFGAPPATLAPEARDDGADAAPEAPAAPGPITASEGEPAKPQVQTLRAARPPAETWPLAAAAFSAAVILLLAPFALYHRVRGAQTLEQGTRQRIFAALRERPGLLAAEAARAAGVDPTTAGYHLHRLAKEGLVVGEGPAGRVRYFAAGTVAPSERPGVVAASGSRAVLDAVNAAPGRTKSELALALGVGRPTISWHVKRLAAAGLVRCERDGKGVRVHPLSAASRSL